MTLATTNWEFWSLLAFLVYQTAKQWLDQKAVALGIANAKIAADHAATAAVNAGVAAQNAALAAAQASMKTDLMADKQDRQHEATNSRLSELLETTRAAAHAAGMLAGIKEEQERAKLSYPAARLEEIRGEP